MGRGGGKVEGIVRLGGVIVANKEIIFSWRMANKPSFLSRGKTASCIGRISPLRGKGEKIFFSSKDKREALAGPQRGGK